MRNQKLKRTILYIGIICIVFSSGLRDICAYTYEYGTVAIENKEFSAKKNGHRIRFNHPYELTEDIIAKILSNIYYKEKGLFKRTGTLRVFQDEEIKKLVSFVVKAFSDATPTQVVTVSSYFKRLLLTDRHNYCVLFIEDRNLNIVFSHVHKFQTYNDIMSEKKRYYYTKPENPVGKRYSSFWKLIPSAGQSLEPGHENWLAIDLSKEITQ